MNSIKPVRQFFPDGLAPFDYAQDKFVFYFSLRKALRHTGAEAQSEKCISSLISPKKTKKAGFYSVL